jgi:outer membrane murein-binding lipoprotein Lpp
MSVNLQRGIAAALACALLAGPASASKLTQLSNSVTYPARKVEKNAKHNVKQPVKSVIGPINQAGQTTTRVFHKVDQQ